MLHKNTHVQKCLQDKTNAILGQRTSLLLIFSHHAVLNIHPCVSAAFQQHWAGKYDTPTCLQLLGWAASSRCCWRPYTMHILSATFLLQNSQNRNRNDFCNCKNTHQSSLNSPNDKAGLQQSRASYRGVKCDRGVKYGLFFFSPTGSELTCAMYEQNRNCLVKLQAFSSELDFLSMKQHRRAGLINMSADYWRHIVVFMGYFSVTCHCQLELQMCKVAQMFKKINLRTCLKVKWILFLSQNQYKTWNFFAG